MVGDLTPEYISVEWRITCTVCIYRAGPFDYARMRAHAPLWFAPQSSKVWAWNRQHLEMLLAVFEGRDVKRHRYAWLATYVPGAWKAHRRAYAKIARRLLDE